MASNKSLDSILFEGVKTMDADMARDPGRTPYESKAIFMLGNTGSGKSTATQIIAGKINQLKAVKTEGGDLIIVDEEEKIGSSTRSMTLYPEYMIHPETGVAFWDTPGFDDNRGADMDIAAMYLLKHALDTTTLGKFIFVVNHSSVKTGNDRLDFDLLASHVTTLLKDITKMGNSLGLLVTKVGNYSPSSGEYLSDEDILAPIKYFLETYVQTKTEDLKGLQEENLDRAVELQAKIDFVNSLLGKNGTEMQPQIFFVRSPQNTGPLAEMSSIFESQRQITELYSNVLKYTLVSPEDFRFTLKTETLLKMETDLIPEAVGRVAETCTDMALDMQVQFQEKFYNNLFDTPEDSLNLLRETAGALRRYLLKCEGNSDSVSNDVAGSFSTELEALHQKLNLSINSSIKMRLASLEKQLEFFAKVLNQNTTRIRNPDSFKPFANLLTALDEMKEFYEFCNNTETELADYAKVGKFTELVEQSKGQVQFGEANVLNFLHANQLVSVSTRTSDIWERMRNEDKEYLVRLVKRMAPRLEMKCSKSTVDTGKNRLVITGRNIKLSDAMNEDKWPQECKNGGVKELSLVALDKLFLDINVDKPNAALQLSMVAPRWEVVLGTDSERHINLSGVQPPQIGKAGSATEYGEKGCNGQAGGRGGNAGSFLGVYSQVHNLERLQISADGGSGGNGQDGGDGKEGKGGRDATPDDFPSAYNFSAAERMGTNVVATGVWYNCERYMKRGALGNRGGDGGNGGKAGDPGKTGSILLYQSSGNSEEIKIKTSTVAGNVGTRGVGGEPGEGGKHGNHYTYLLQNILIVGFQWNFGETFYVKEKAESGNKGLTGGEAALNSAVTPVNIPWREINEYRALDFKNMSRSGFPVELEATPEISRLVTSQALAEELVTTENLFYEMAGMEGSRKPDYFIKYYKTFLKRLGVHGNAALERNELTTQDKIALNIMYTTVLGKVIALQQADYRLNVINTKDYFDAVALQLDSLKSAEKEKVIQDETQKFHRKLDKKVNEAMALIQETVQPSIKNAEAVLEQMNDKLLAEINAYLAAADADLEMKKQMKRDFESAMPLKMFFSALNVVSSVVSCLGPYGAAAGSVINTASSIIQPCMSLPDTPSRGAVSLKLPAGVGTALDDLNSAYFGKRIKKIEHKINVILDAGKIVEGDELKDVTQFALETQKSLESLKSTSEEGGKVSSVDLSKLEEDGDELSAMVMKKIDQAEKAEGQKNINKKIIENLSTVMETADSILGLVQTHMQNASELERLAELVREAEENVKSLEAKKDQFYDELMPELMAIQNDIAVESGQLAGQSQVGLSVKKWKIKDMVKGMRWYLQQFAKGFQVLEDFQVCHDRLEEALTLLVDLYDHIERYEEKKEFADYIGNVNSSSGTLHQIHDSELRAALGRLDFFMQANMFLGDHQRAMHAFKQWVFPFASSYLAGNEDRKRVVPTNFDELVNIYKLEVKGLQLQLAKYQATTDKGDEVLMITTFTSDAVSTRPFYVWTSSGWQDSITKLLSGEPVQLKADVDMKDQRNRAFFEGKSAIKYKTVELMMKAHSAGKQVELDERLKRYQMRMTHSGISMYKVRGQNYVMFDKKQTYIYSFERIGNDESVSVNGVRYKVSGADADYLQSPYTWWTFQLIDATPEEGNGFHELQEFANQIDLELEGKGVYLNEKLASQEILSNLKLHEYYDVSDDNVNQRMLTAEE